MVGGDTSLTDSTLHQEDTVSNHVRIAIGAPGHETEAIVMISGFNLENMLPRRASGAVQVNLPRYLWVDNRGTRLEICGVGDEFKSADRAKHLPVIRAAVRVVAADLLGIPREQVTFTEEVFDYLPPAPSLRYCDCGCGLDLTLKERWTHKQAKKAAAA